MTCTQTVFPLSFFFDIKLLSTSLSSALAASFSEQRLLPWSLRLSTSDGACLACAWKAGGARVRSASESKGERVREEGASGAQGAREGGG